MSELQHLYRVIGQLERRVRELETKLHSTVVRATISDVNDDTSMQTLRILGLAGTDGDEDDDEIEHFPLFGMTSNPPPGSEALAFGVGGQRAHTIVVGVGHRGTRPKGLKSGETMLYDASGNQVYLQDGKKTSIVADEVNVGDLVSLLAAARVTDPVAATPTMGTWMGQVTDAVTKMAAQFNLAPPGTPLVSLAPGPLAPTPPAAPPAQIGAISGGSAKVKIS